jgi:hypothetical protein
MITVGFRPSEISIFRIYCREIRRKREQGAGRTGGRREGERINDLEDSNWLRCSIEMREGAGRELGWSWENGALRGGRGAGSVIRGREGAGGRRKENRP